MLKYIRFFFYLSWHWNPALAAFVCYHEIRGTRTFKMFTTEFESLEKLEDQGIDISHATMYMPANYYGLEKIFDAAQKLIKSPMHFLDLGCGKGRTLVVAAYYGYPKITGVDFSSSYCEAARQLTRSFETKFPDQVFKIYLQDAFYFEIPKDADFIFLFNPFDEVIMSGVVANILRSQRLFPRPVYVAYLNPQHQSLFVSEGFRPVFHFKKLKYLEGVILVRLPA